MKLRQHPMSQQKIGEFRERFFREKNTLLKKVTGQ